VFGQKYLFVKDASQGFKYSKVLQSQKISGSLSAIQTMCHPVRTPICHCSIRPDDVPYRPDARQTKHHPFERRAFMSGPSIVSRRFCPTCIRPDVSAARPDVRQPWFERAFIKEGNCRFNFNHPDDCLSWSGRAHIGYENCVLKISRPDVYPPMSGRAKPYMENTCSGRATVRTTVSSV
jgi:hypothetical protein